MGQVEWNTTGFVYGTLQVFLGGDFGAVCTNRFTATDADVACRQMGFVGGVSLGALGNPLQILEGVDLVRYECWAVALQAPGVGLKRLLHMIPASECST